MGKVVLDFEKPVVELEQKIDEMKKFSDNLDIADEITTLEKKVSQLRENIFSNLTRWQRVQLARHPERPYTLDYIGMMTTGFIELHGDRLFGDDKSIVGGFAKLDGPDRDDDRPSEGERYEIEFVQEFRNAAARRVSQSTPFDEARRKIRQADYYAA